MVKLRGFLLGLAGFALGFWLVAMSGLNPIGRVVDYFQNGIRKAALSDYAGIQGITDYEKQVIVYDNFVEVRVGEFKEKLTTVAAGGVETVTTEMRPILTYRYKDFNEDGHVDDYEVSDNQNSKYVVHIHSAFVWNKIYAPHLPNFNDAEKYSDKELQRKIDDDYSLLRQKGTRVNGTAYPPGGSWFDEYPIRLKSGEKPPPRLKVEIK